MKFRKKPVVVEAFQYHAEMHNLPKWAICAELTIFRKNNYVLISTLEGQMRAHPGDWIIKGINGELYPCKPDIFAKTYEPVYEATSKIPPKIDIDNGSVDGID